MAGIANVVGGYYEFSTDRLGDAEEIRRSTGGMRVVTFQADGEELDAILWGIENWKQLKDRPVQQQLQYQEVTCPNCFAKGDSISETDYEGGFTHICHDCGQSWLHE